MTAATPQESILKLHEIEDYLHELEKGLHWASYTRWAIATARHNVALAACLANEKGLV